MTDYPGIALIIAARTGGVGTLITSGLAIATFFKQGARDAKIAQVHDLVNHMSQEKTVADKEVSRAEGKAEGIAEERAAPMIVAPMDVKAVNLPSDPVSVDPTKAHK
jgi:hypothetical protein